jgi:hypothetical protein
MQADLAESVNQLSWMRDRLPGGQFLNPLVIC